MKLPKQPHKWNMAAHLSMWLNGSLKFLGREAMKEAFFRFMESLGFVPEQEAARAERLAVADVRKVCTAKPHEEIAIELVKHGELIYRTCLCGEVYDGEISMNRLWWADHKARKVAELWKV